MIAPATTGTKINPHEAWLAIITNGSAPAGGCSVLVSCITAIVVPTPRAKTHQLSPNICPKATDIVAAIKCPPITLRG